MDAGSGEWKESVQLVFEYFCERTPRSFVEQRGTSLVWNYKYAGEHCADSGGRRGMRNAVNRGSKTFLGGREEGGRGVFKYILRFVSYVRNGDRANHT